MHVHLTLNGRKPYKLFSRTQETLKYSLHTNDVVRWAPDALGHWGGKKVGTVTWFSETRFRIDLE